MSNETLKVGLLRLGHQAYHKSLLREKAAHRTNLANTTTLDVAIGPPVRILHADPMTEKQQNSLRKAITGARQQAEAGAKGLASGTDQKVKYLREDFENCFKFDMKKHPAMFKLVARTAGQIRRGVMSENLSIKFYGNGDQKALYAKKDGVVASAIQSYNKDKNPRCIISLSEKVFNSSTGAAEINHEIAHNLAALNDYGKAGYSVDDFTEVNSKMLPTRAIPAGGKGGKLKPIQAINNADSYAAYLYNREVITREISEPERTGENSISSSSFNDNDSDGEPVRNKRERETDLSSEDEPQRQRQRTDGVNMATKLDERSRDTNTRDI